MAKMNIKVKIQMRSWCKLLYPVWFLQVALGFKPFVPKCCFKMELV